MNPSAPSFSAPSCERKPTASRHRVPAGQTLWNVSNVCHVLKVKQLVQTEECEVPAPDLRKELWLILHKPPQAEAEPLHQQRGAGGVAHALHSLGGGAPRLHRSVW